MKGLLKSFIILSCACLFSNAKIATDRYVTFTKATNETALEETYMTTKDGCLKSTISLYKVYKYIDEGEMDAGCNPVNRYGKYLDRKNECNQEKYLRYFITTALKQRRYICQEQIPSDKKDDFCNPDGANRKAGLSEDKIKNKYCASGVGHLCKDNYKNFMVSLKNAFYNSSKETLSTTVSIYNKSIFNLTVYRVKDKIVETAEKYCVDTDKPSDDPSNISTNGKCGKTDGICPTGECCSKHGYCGKSTDHCEKSKGCQSEFGKCNGDGSVTTNKPTTTTTKKAEKTSTNGKCGEKDGFCPNNECCSKHGYCGRSSDHCKVSKGCQSGFGRCDGSVTTEKIPVTTTTTTTKKALPTSTNGKCGEKYGICPKDECCSKHGYCGKSSDHCKVSKGCQSEFGKCNGSVTTERIPVTTTTTTTKKALPTSTNGKCGKADGICPSGECCSAYGYCGKSSAHCEKASGCQSEFGKCNGDAVTTKKTTKTTKKTTKTTKKTTKTTKKTTKTTKKSTSTLEVRKDGKCGKNVGKCQSGYCCSQYGYCGKSDAHCKSGCQSEFGTCN